MDAQERREARLSRRRERERRNRALESAEERERLARRRVLKGQSSASCTVYCSLASQTYFRERMRANAFTEKRLARETKSTEGEEALQRRRERGFRAEFTYVRTYIYVCTAAYARP